MFDAPMGNHQLAVDSASQEKLAFQGVDAIKWNTPSCHLGQLMFLQPSSTLSTTSTVFGRNWQSLGFTIDNDTNTHIIVDDIISWADTFQHSLLYMRCQFITCCAYCLSLNLDKSHFFPRCFEFVGINVAPRAIAQPSPNISCLRRGLPQSWSESG